MWDFIVSGWLPGTSFQISFEHCLIAAGILFTIGIFRWIVQRRRTMRALMQLQNAQQTDIVTS